MTMTHNETGQQTCILYRTGPHPCSYLQDQTAKTLFLDPATRVNENLYTQLSELGFRRSGNIYYRPDCGNCQACVPTRIATTEFKPRRSQRRTIHRNRDLTFGVIPSYFSEEIYALYEQYIATQHADGDMYPATEQQFRDFLCIEKSHQASNPDQHQSYFLCLRDKGRLVAVAVMDQLTNGLTAAYTFYDTREKKRSLGRYCILLQISLVKALKLEYLYLGYWIRQCQKMSYKTDFTPVELLLNSHWQRYNDTTDINDIIISADI